MRLPEQRLWDRLKRANDNFCVSQRLLLERIENAVGSGRPDVDSLFCGKFVPLELKAVEATPARITTPVLGKRGLNQQQKNWHKRWAAAGGSSIILVGVGAKMIYLISGHHHDVINAMPINSLLEMASCVGSATDVLNFIKGIGK